MGRHAKTKEDLGTRGNTRKQSVAKFKERLASARELPALDVENLVKPKWLTARARKLWDEQVPMLIDQGMVCALDTLFLAKYFQVVARAIECEELVAKEGDIITIPNKTNPRRPSYRERPEVALAKEYWKEAAAIGATLGLTPKARRNLGVSIATGKSAANDSPTGAQIITTKRLPPVIQGMVPGRPLDAG